MTSANEDRSAALDEMRRDRSHDIWTPPSAPRPDMDAFFNAHRASLLEGYSASRMGRAMLELAARLVHQRGESTYASPIFRACVMIVVAAVGTLTGDMVLGPNAELVLSYFVSTPARVFDTDLAVALDAEIAQEKSKRIRAVSTVLLAAQRVARALRHHSLYAHGPNLWHCLSAFSAAAEAVLGDRLAQLVAASIPVTSFDANARLFLACPAPRFGRSFDGHAFARVPDSTSSLLSAAVAMGLPTDRMHAAILECLEIAAARASSPRATEAVAAARAVLKTRHVASITSADDPRTYYLEEALRLSEDALVPSGASDGAPFNRALAKTAALFMPVLARTLPEAVELMREHRDFAIEHGVLGVGRQDPRKAWAKFERVLAASAPSMERAA